MEIEKYTTRDLLTEKGEKTFSLKEKDISLHNLK